MRSPPAVAAASPMPSANRSRRRRRASRAARTRRAATRRDSRRITRRPSSRISADSPASIAASCRVSTSSSRVRANRRRSRANMRRARRVRSGSRAVDHSARAADARRVATRRSWIASASPPARTRRAGDTRAAAKPCRCSTTARDRSSAGRGPIGRSPVVMCAPLRRRAGARTRASTARWRSCPPSASHPGCGSRTREPGRPALRSPDPGSG